MEALSNAVGTAATAWRKFFCQHYAIFPIWQRAFFLVFSWLVPALAYSQQGQNFLTMGVQLTNVANFRLLFFYGSKKMDSICNGPILSITWRKAAPPQEAVGWKIDFFSTYIKSWIDID